MRRRGGGGGGKREERAEADGGWAKSCADAARQSRPLCWEKLRHLFSSSSVRPSRSSPSVSRDKLSSNVERLKIEENVTVVDRTSRCAIKIIVSCTHCSS